MDADQHGLKAKKLSACTHVNRGPNRAFQHESLAARRVHAQHRYAASFGRSPQNFYKPSTTAQTAPPNMNLVLKTKGETDDTVRTDETTYAD
jgi:hypothetical protein